MSETIKLQNLIDEVTDKKLVLPDFQRKFVWEQNDMYGLFSSVLCKMPFGSILTLESTDKEFSCKKLGAKPKECHEEIESGKQIEYLIDGQQRLTSLFAGFTTYYFSAFKDIPKKIAAPRLLEMYFIKIPAENNENSIDLFNAKKLSFDCNRENTENNYFSSEEMKQIISSEKISKIIKERKTEVFDLESKADLDSIASYCTNNVDGFYRIPLQFILCNKGKIFRTYNKILEKIAISFSDESENSEDLREEWIDNVKKYLTKCLDELELNRIKVKNSDKSRAIDIYSNLNRGGVALNVFDLIMAKVGSVSKENFYDTLVGYIQSEYSYPEPIKNNPIIQIAIPNNYHATKIAEVLSDKDDITAEYVNNFLNVLSLYIAKIEKKDFSPDLIKQDKILNLDAKKIVSNSKKVCEALDRALFFFQTRCGIRKVSDINYKAQFAVVAYFFTDDDLFSDIRVHNFFEYWYWISLFAYMYPSNQNVMILNEIPYFSKYFESKFSDNSIFTRFKQYVEHIMDIPHYSDKSTIVMEHSAETETAPQAVFTKYVCQFYLTKGYKDFFDSNINLNFLYQDTLQIHHLLPLGSDGSLKVGESTAKLRKDKFNKYNSPMNMLYITKSSNTTISDWDYNRYSQDDRISKIVNQLGCTTGFNINIEDFLSSRFDKFSSDVENRIEKLKETLV